MRTRASIVPPRERCIRFHPGILRFPATVAKRPFLKSFFKSQAHCKTASKGNHIFGRRAALAPAVRVGHSSRPFSWQRAARFYFMTGEPLFWIFDGMDAEARFAPVRTSQRRASILAMKLPRDAAAPKKRVRAETLFWLV